MVNDGVSVVNHEGPRLGQNDIHITTLDVLILELWVSLNTTVLNSLLDQSRDQLTIPLDDRLGF